jgi:phage N-6-adenine-methyltransferase
MSLEKDSWETPDSIYQKFGGRFQCTLDVCASESNTKCPTFFDEHINGLSSDWYGRVWCNPPYSNIKAWVAKAYRQRNNCQIIIMLLPAKTDTKWFHSYIYRKATITFLKGKVVFTKRSEIVGRPNFSSMIVVFKPDTKTFRSNEEQLTLWPATNQYR